MPTFAEVNGVLSAIPLREFATERELQRLTEANLDATFGCKLIATEFSTGLVHSGRIDTLALSEDGSPVIIEYKKVESASLINQALFYLDWIKDHHGDFEIAAKKVLGDVAVDWSSIRVICLAPNYDNYSIHAVRHMSAGIELWRYRRYANETLELEEVFRSAGDKRGAKATHEVAASDAATEEVPTYTVDEHRVRANEEIAGYFDQVNEFIVGLDDAVAIVPRKLYIAYKLARNLVCVEVQIKKLVLTLNRKAFESMPPNFHDVTGKGHWGTGDVEVHVFDEESLASALSGIRETYLLAGGN